MFEIGEYVYHVNEKGYLSNEKRKIAKITNSVIVLDASFKGKQGSVRKFYIYIDKRFATKTLFKTLNKARHHSQKRIEFINKKNPFQVGDILSWGNDKYQGMVIEVGVSGGHCFCKVDTPTRVWSLDPFRYDVRKLH